MNNKGFTLIEITAVVMLLALILLLVIPKTLEIKEKQNDKIDENLKKILFSDTEEFIINNKKNIKAGNVYCISVNTLINENATSVDMKKFRNIIVRASAVTENRFTFSTTKNTCNEVIN